MKKKKWQMYTNILQREISNHILSLFLAQKWRRTRRVESEYIVSLFRFVLQNKVLFATGFSRLLQNTALVRSFSGFRDLEKYHRTKTCARECILTHCQKPRSRAVVRVNKKIKRTNSVITDQPYYGYYSRRVREGVTAAATTAKRVPEGRPDEGRGTDGRVQECSARLVSSWLTCCAASGRNDKRADSTYVVGGGEATRPPSTCATPGAPAAGRIGRRVRALRAHVGGGGGGGARTAPYKYRRTDRFSSPVLDRAASSRLLLRRNPSSAVIISGRRSDLNSVPTHTHTRAHEHTESANTIRSTRLRLLHSPQPPRVRWCFRRHCEREIFSLFRTRDVRSYQKTHTTAIIIETTQNNSYDWCEYYRKTI